MKSLFAIIAACLMVSFVVPAAAQDATPGVGASLLAGLGYPELRITSDGVGFDLPAELDAGRYGVVLHNESRLDIDLEFYQLPEGATVDDLLAAYATLHESGYHEIPDLFFELDFNGGASSGPDGTGEVILDLTPGEWVANLLAFDEATQSDIVVPKMVTVTSEMPVLDDPAGVLEIGMAEMDFTLPSPIGAGPQVWKLTNNGQTGHHLILAQVPQGTTEEQFFDLLNSSGSEAGVTPDVAALGWEDVVDVFDILAISSGRANWIEVDLAPGTYAAVCFLPDNETGMPHAMLGMVEVFTVE